MALIGKVEHLGWDLQQLKRSEKLKALGDIEPVIKLSVDHQRGRLELGDELIRRPLLVGGGIRPRSALELPDVEPQFLGCPESGNGVEHAIVRDHAFEAGSVTKQPINGISPVRSAQRAFTLFIYKR